MSRSERLISLMKLREVIRARRQARAVDELAGEIDRAKGVQEKLTSLIQVNTPLHEPMAPSALRSRAWYGRQMQEQLDVLENRGAYLTNELVQARTALMHHKNREKILEERRIVARKAEIESHENRAEGQLPPRGVKPDN